MNADSSTFCGLPESVLRETAGMGAGVCGVGPQHADRGGPEASTAAAPMYMYRRRAALACSVSSLTYDSCSVGTHRQADVVNKTKIKM